MNNLNARRNFLQFLAASPLIATSTVASSVAALVASAPSAGLAQSYDALRGANVATGDDGIITAPHEAINVFEFEPAAKKALFAQGAPTHWGYLESGVDGDVTRDINHTAYARYNIRVQRLVDARNVDTSVKIFGETWGSPIFICPVSSLGAYNGEAGVAVARAAGKRKHQMILSTVDNASIADVNKAHGWPAWFMVGAARSGTPSRTTPNSISSISVSATASNGRAATVAKTKGTTCSCLRSWH